MGVQVEKANGISIVICVQKKGFANSRLSNSYRVMNTVVPPVQGPDSPTVRIWSQPGGQKDATIYSGRFLAPLAIPSLGSLACLLQIYQFYFPINTWLLHLVTMPVNGHMDAAEDRRSAISSRTNQAAH